MGFESTTPCLQSMPSKSRNCNRRRTPNHLDVTHPSHLAFRNLLNVICTMSPCSWTTFSHNSTVQACQAAPLALWPPSALTDRRKQPARPKDRTSTLEQLLLWRHPLHGPLLALDRAPRPWTASRERIVPVQGNLILKPSWIKSSAHHFLDL